MTTENHTPDTTSATAAKAAPRGLPRGLVWVLLLLAVAANAGVSVFSLPIAIGVAFGIIAFGLGALLVRDHYRRRAQPTR